MSESTLQQRSDRFDLRAIYETSRLLSASLELDFVLNNLLLIGMSKLFVTRGLVLLDDPVAGGHKVAASKGISSVKTDAIINLDGFSTEEAVFDEKIPIILKDLGLYLLLPISFGHRDIGFIALGPKATKTEFLAQEIEFVKSLVHMSSTAVHNSLVVGELKQANRDLDGKIQELNTLFDLSQEFNTIIDRDQLIKLFSFALMGQLLIGKYLFILCDTDVETGGAKFEMVARRGLSADAIPAAFNENVCIIDQVTFVADNEIGDLKKLGIALVIPLKMQNQTRGILCLGPKMSGTEYAHSEVEFLKALGNLTLVSLHNSDLLQEQLVKQRLEEEMALARTIQEGLHPQSMPEMQGLDIATLATPSRHVAGDYFDLIPLDEDRLLIAIADVTGKGVPASLLMANVQACLRVLAPLPIPLTEATARINAVIHQNTGYDKFITYFHGIYHKKEKIFVSVNAGHDPPILIRKNGEMKYLNAGGLLLGVLPEVTYEKERHTLSAGDVIVMFTDGVTEAMNQDHEEYTLERLEEVLRQCYTESADTILNTVKDDVAKFVNGTPLSDDMTMLVIRVK